MADAATLRRNYELLLEFLYLIPVGVVQFTADGAIRMANPTAAALLLPLSDGKDLSDLYRLFRRDVLDLRAVVAAAPSALGQVCRDVAFAVEGANTVLAVSVYKVSEETFVALIQDITGAVEKDRRIRESDARLQAIVDNVRDYAIYTLDLDGHVDLWNRSLYRLCGWREDDVLGRSASMFIADAENRDERQKDLLARALQGGSAELEDWRVRRDGSRFWGSCVLTVLPNADGRPKGFVAVTRDLTQRKALEDRLLALATIDPLTGALNRRAGDVRLEEAFESWTRRNAPFSLLLVDCDHFKAVNDRYGHDTGDQVLIGTVQACRQALRADDPVIRMGGEEFLVLLAGIAMEEATVVAERVRAVIGATVMRPGASSLRITVSIGVAACMAGDESYGDVVRRADTALYVAKRSGRDRVSAG